LACTNTPQPRCQIWKWFIILLLQKLKNDLCFFQKKLLCIASLSHLFCLWSNRALGNQNKWVFWRGSETKKKDGKERLPAITKVQICQLCLWMNELNCCWFALAFNGQSCYTMSCLFIVSQFSFNLVSWTPIPPQISFHQSQPDHLRGCRTHKRCWSLNTLEYNNSTLDCLKTKQLEANYLDIFAAAVGICTWESTRRFKCRPTYCSKRCSPIAQSVLG
jgi:hypothetical protein